jgi:hypothetical protein
VRRLFSGQLQILSGQNRVRKHPTTPHTNFYSERNFIYLSQTTVYVLTAGVECHYCTWLYSVIHTHTHTHTHTLLVFPCSRDRSVAQTSTWQHIIFVRDNRLCPGRIRTRSPSKTAAAVHSAPILSAQHCQYDCQGWSLLCDLLTTPTVRTL